jgi:hypothetical protein
MQVNRGCTPPVKQKTSGAVLLLLLVLAAPLFWL